jgi:hypothetical protein
MNKYINMILADIFDNFYYNITKHNPFDDFTKINKLYIFIIYLLNILFNITINIICICILYYCGISFIFIIHNTLKYGWLLFLILFKISIGIIIFHSLYEIF